MIFIFFLKNKEIKDIEKLTRIRKNIKELKCKYKKETEIKIKKLEKNINL